PGRLAAGGRGAGRPSLPRRPRRAASNPRHPLRKWRRADDPWLAHAPWEPDRWSGAAAPGVIIWGLCRGSAWVSFGGDAEARRHVPSPRHKRVYARLRRAMAGGRRTGPPPNPLLAA